jgi:hypothetical protein
VKCIDDVKPSLGGNEFAYNSLIFVHSQHKHRVIHSERAHGLMTISLKIITCEHKGDPVSACPFVAPSLSVHEKEKPPFPESASELYRPSDLRFSVKLVPTSTDRGSHVVSVTDPYGRVLDVSRPQPLLFPSSSSSASNRPTGLVVNLMEQPGNNRRLRRHLSSDLPTRFLV